MPGSSPPNPGSLCDSQPVERLGCNDQGNEWGRVHGLAVPPSRRDRLPLWRQLRPFIKNSIDGPTWVQLGSISGGEVISSDQVLRRRAGGVEPPVFSAPDRGLTPPARRVPVTASQTSNAYACSRTYRSTVSRLSQSAIFRFETLLGPPPRFYGYPIPKVQGAAGITLEVSSRPTGRGHRGRPPRGGHDSP